jgi:predicted nucleotidyltransferase
MLYGLKEEIINGIKQVFSHYKQVDEVIIYGSRAKGDFKRGSDIDLTLKGENINLSILNKIDIELDDLLLPYTFDLSIFSHIDNPDLVDHIHRVGKIFYSK